MSDKTTVLLAKTRRSGDYYFREFGLTRGRDRVVAPWMASLRGLNTETVSAVVVNSDESDGDQEWHDAVQQFRVYEALGMEVDWVGFG